MFALQTVGEELFAEIVGFVVSTFTAILQIALAFHAISHV
jgi:hypothetical protein